MAVKVRRPGIDRTIEADLAVLADLARLAERHVPDAELYSLSDLVGEFARTIRRELDLTREGHIVERVAAQFTGDPTLRFPRICWEMTTPTVLTMEYLDGVKVSAVGTGAAPGLDPVVAVATLLRPVNMDLLAADLAEMLDLYADVPIGELSWRGVFQSITAAMARHRLRLAADVLLLIKAVSTIESVGRQLDPSFRIVEYATPHVEEMLARKRRPGALAKRAAGSGHDVLKALATMPANLAELLGTARRGGLRVEIVHRNLDHFIREMDRSSNRLSFAVVIAAIVVASAIMVHAARLDPRRGVIRCWGWLGL